MGTWTYNYDDMNRLVSGTAAAGVDAGLILGWTYDRYGNRWAQNATGTGNATAVQGQLTFTGNNNRIDGWSYDAAGNLLYDYIHHYTYDAENRIVTLDGQPTYIYDAEGRRVAKLGAGGTVTASYVLGLGGEQLSELNGAGQWVHSNVFAGGKLLATYAGPGDTSALGYHYHLTDWLGTQRMQTNVNGNEEERCYSYPFGDGLNCTGSDATEHHFTSKERDAESGLDYFGARYLSSNLGRFMAPDWAAAPISAPYAQFGDPQSLNLYAYVGNNPNTGIDLDGHDGIENGDGYNSGIMGMSSELGAMNGTGGPGQDWLDGKDSNSSNGGSSGGSSNSAPPTPAPSNPNPASPDPAAQQQQQSTTPEAPASPAAPPALTPAQQQQAAAAYAEKTTQTPAEAQALASVIQNRINSGQSQYVHDGSVINPHDLQGVGGTNYNAFMQGHAAGAGAQNATAAVGYVQAHGPTTNATFFIVRPGGAPPTARMLHNLGHVVPGNPPRVGDVFLFVPAQGH
jgi:RHS repeat-associated protein